MRVNLQYLIILKTKKIAPAHQGVIAATQFPLAVIALPRGAPVTQQLNLGQLSRNALRANLSSMETMTNVLLILNA